MTDLEKHVNYFLPGPNVEWQVLVTASQPVLPASQVASPQAQAVPGSRGNSSGLQAVYYVQFIDVRWVTEEF